MDDGNSFKGVSWDVFKESDILYQTRQYHRVNQLLKAQRVWEYNEQILWRLASSEYKRSLEIKFEEAENGISHQLSKKVHSDAYKYALQSIELDDTNGQAHKWAAITMEHDDYNENTDYKNREKMMQLHNHVCKAIHYLPHLDATSYHAFGQSYYKFYWLYDFFSKDKSHPLFKAYPQYALDMFEKAEQIKTDPFTGNTMMKALMLLTIGRNTDLAFNLLRRIISNYAVNPRPEDKEVCLHATILYLLYRYCLYRECYLM